MLTLCLKPVQERNIQPSSFFVPVKLNPCVFPHSEVKSKSFQVFQYHSNFMKKILTSDCIVVIYSVDLA